MKAEIRSSAPKDFVPFEIVFKIDTLADAKEFSRQFEKTSMNFHDDIYMQLKIKIEESENG